MSGKVSGSKQAPPVKPKPERFRLQPAATSSDLQNTAVVPLPTRTSHVVTEGAAAFAPKAPPPRPSKTPANEDSAVSNNGGAPSTQSAPGFSLLAAVTDPTKFNLPVSGGLRTESSGPPLLPPKEELHEDADTTPQSATPSLSYSTSVSSNSTVTSFQHPQWVSPLPFPAPGQNPCDDSFGSVLPAQPFSHTAFQIHDPQDPFFASNFQPGTLPLPHLPPRLPEKKPLDDDASRTKRLAERYSRPAPLPEELSPQSSLVELPAEPRPPARPKKKRLHEPPIAELAGDTPLTYPEHPKREAPQPPYSQQVVGPTKRPYPEVSVIPCGAESLESVGVCVPYQPPESHIQQLAKLRPVPEAWLSGMPGLPRVKDHQVRIAVELPGSTILLDINLKDARSYENRHKHPTWKAYISRRLGLDGPVPFKTLMSFTPPVQGYVEHDLAAKPGLRAKMGIEQAWHSVNPQQLQQRIKVEHLDNLRILEQLNPPLFDTEELHRNLLDTLAADNAAPIHGNGGS